MKIIFVILFISFLFACRKSQDASVKAQLIMINLSQKFADKNLQISGMDWYGDTLFFLNQIPSEYNSSIFFSTREDILTAISSRDSLILHNFNFQQDGVADKIGKIPDYEAITFKGDSVYLLIEAEKPMRSFIIQGIIKKEGLSLNPETLTRIPLKHNLHEIACEAMLLLKDRIYVFFEANGANIDKNPYAFCYDLALTQIKLIPIDNIEYRITDATKMQKNNSFWVINHFWPGEMEILNPAPEIFEPSTYDNNKNGVNRLIQLQIEDNKIKVKNNRPLMLPAKDWNWEALVSFDSSSFLIVNDEFSSPPNRTGLGYIKIDLDE